MNNFLSQLPSETIIGVHVRSNTNKGMIKTNVKIYTQVRKDNIYDVSDKG